jgi:hypothetical protein
MPIPSFYSASRRGSALLLVVISLLLLVTLVVAFLSRATLERQLSGASANLGKTDLAAQGAVSMVISDLQQEIVAGSNGSGTPAVASGYYYPTSPLTMVPQVVGFTQGVGVEDLLKISKNGVGNAFYSGSNYNTTSFPAPNRAANVSTTTASLNGRAISTARWNAPLLMAKATPTSATDFTPVAAFTANPPDWIYVAQDGSNPQAWNATYASTGTNPVLQRYAYAIYDEGSTLDMNVAGSPAYTPGTPTTSPGYGTVQPYKNALAYADLTQILSASTVTPAISPALQQQIINAIVGWRNYATMSYVDPATGIQQPSQVSNSFPLYSIANTPISTTPPTTPPSTLTPFDLGMLSNSTGFLSVSATNLGKQGQANLSDNVFVSRQQLIEFLTQGLGQNTTFNTTGTSLLASLQDALPYLGTFSRDVSQPSYAPAQSRPTTLSLAAGGNDKSGGDTTINPSFVDVPAVKKFALNRLAWLTYLGPIADDSGHLNNNPASTLYVGGNAAAFTTLINLLETNYGFSAAFLAEGGPTNIYTSFGLSWITDSRVNIGDSEYKWVYNHESATFLTSLPAVHNPIRTLGSGGAYTVPTTRSPDFFELIKAGTSVGSLGKAYNYNATPTAVLPADYQEQRDNSVDLQILQIGANIVDQFDADDYSTRIIFTDGLLFGGVFQEIRGVEDLPYIYRLREGKITVTDSSPSEGACPTVMPAMVGTPGQVAVLQEEEIWNPHVWSSADTDTNPRPVSFRAVAISTDPNSSSSSAVKVTPELTCCLTGTGYSTTPYIFSTPNPAWNESTTELDFNIPRNDLYLFREPTLLIKPNVPAGSNLNAGANNLIRVNWPAGYILSQWPAYQIAGNGAVDNKEYLGFLAGAGPAAWNRTIPVGGVDGIHPTMATPGVVEATSESLSTALNGITYRIQYQDPNAADPTASWATYDEKYAGYVAGYSYNNGAFWTPRNKTFYAVETGNTQAENIISEEIAEVCFDPRTSRFGMGTIGPVGYRGAGADEFPVRLNVNNDGWAGTNGITLVPSGPSFTGAINQLAMQTQRPDQYVGYNWDTDTAGGLFMPTTGPSALGWYPGASGGNTAAHMATNTGMFAQNNPSEVAAVAYSRQTGLDGQTSPGPFNEYFADPDNVVRRAMGGWVPTDATEPADPPPAAGQPWGLPMMTADNYSTNPPTATANMASRPVMLNRPFRSVAELGYVFTGTPWRNLNMSIPESGSSPLLDIFCINDTNDPNDLVAGKVNLNTRQIPVLAAILSGAYKDETYQKFGAAANSPLASANSTLTSTYANAIATALVKRTSSATANPGPLTNVSQLVGAWKSSQTVGTPTAINGGTSYIGFSSDTVNSTGGNITDITQALQSIGAIDAEKRLTRLREASIRALAATGTTRVWNLMIDVIAQTGRFPSNAATAASPLAAFAVSGERRYWVHVAIDRYTGKVLDERIEEVKE